MNCFTVNESQMDFECRPIVAKIIYRKIRFLLTPANGKTRYNKDHILKETLVETRWLSCKILPKSWKNCLSCKIWQKMVILQDLPENGYPSRFLQVRSAQVVLLLVPIHATHFILTRNLLKNHCVFFRKNKNLNRFESGNMNYLKETN